jgi:hypothetical protein
MPAQLLADAEALVSAFLRAHPDVVALGGHVGGRLPPVPPWPCLILHRVGGVAGWPSHLDRARIQFESWADDRDQAHHGVAVLRAVLQQLPGVRTYTSLDAPAVATVTAVVEDGGPLWSPDRIVTPARPRYLFTAVVFTHP